MKGTWKRMVRAALFLSAFAFAAGSSWGEILHAADQEDLRRGGQLYDKWYQITGTVLQAAHPLYPATGKQAGASTWRCKECHGWDYLGKDGRYRQGSHHTGIRGVYEARTKDAEELAAALSAGLKDHDFSSYLDMEKDIKPLVAFLQKGLIDFSTVLTPAGEVKGNSANGQKLYQAHCASCHGGDGDGIDFKKKDEGIQGIGWLAAKNPQESLHKIRWGHPGSDMPSMVVDVGLSDAETVDILAYSSTLR